MLYSSHFFFFFFFNDTATTEIYTLSLHDALPISENRKLKKRLEEAQIIIEFQKKVADVLGIPLKRSEEHTSELQSQSNLVCRLLLEKKKKKKKKTETARDETVRVNSVSITESQQS